MSLPTPPLRRDGQALFSARGDAFMAALPAFEIDMNAVAVAAAASAAAAAASAVDSVANQAALSAALAEAADLVATAEQVSIDSRNASLWLAATNYAIGAAAYSPINQKVYRRLVSGIFATDPSADPARWALIDGGLTVVVVAGVTATAATGSHYVATNVASTTLTLPLVPASGDTVWVSFMNGLTTNTIARNGNTVMGLAEDLSVDSVGQTIQLRYINSDWRIL